VERSGASTGSALKNKMRLNYIIIPLITLGVSWFGSRLTSSGMDWYQTINLPAWTPSGSVIGLAWTIIFILGTISALIVWNKKDKDGIASSPAAPRDDIGEERLAASRQAPRNDIRKKRIIVLFLVNAGLNLAWSWLFFEQHLLGPAVWEAGLLGLSVIVLIILIWPFSKLAAWLLVPYGGWVIFATYLTYLIWTLNR
jgi:benzodiazapine receptor